MSKLIFTFATMDAGKSTHLLQAAHNYEYKGMRPLALTAADDDRAGTGVIASRIGIEREALTYTTETDLFELVLSEHERDPIVCVFVEEAQWLKKEQVWQLTEVVDRLNLPVMAYGLRLDFQAELFEGSKYLLAWGQEFREVHTICRCGKKATFVLRKDEDGNPLKDGPQFLVGGNDTYESVCRTHWKEAFKD